MLEPGSFLEFYQDEVIPYRHASYRQYTEVDMAADASLILTDGLTAGWSPDGLRFQYGEVGLRTRVRREGRLIYNDYTLCNPGYDPMDHLGFFEGYTNFNSCVIIDPAIDADFINRARRLLAEEQTDGLRFGLSLLDCGGVVLRMLGFDALANHRVERRLVDVFREEYKSCAPLALRKNDHTRSS